MMNLQLKVPPALLLVLFLIFCWLLKTFLPEIPGVPTSLPFAKFIAGTFVLLGVAVIVSGVLEFRRHHTTVNPLAPDEASTVVSSGIFRLSRNPMYLGMLLILVAGVVTLFCIASVALIPAFIWYMNTFQIKPEERILLRQFGPAYQHYLESTRRWL